MHSQLLGTVTQQWILSTRSKTTAHIPCTLMALVTIWKHRPASTINLVLVILPLSFGCIWTQQDDPDQSRLDYTNFADQITGGTLTTGQWYYVALCRASGSTRLFVNGTQSGSTYTDANSYLASTLTVGSDGTSPGSYLNGYIDDLRVTKYARYTTTFTPPTSTFQTKW